LKYVHGKRAKAGVRHGHIKVTVPTAILGDDLTYKSTWILPYEDVREEEDFPDDVLDSEALMNAYIEEKFPVGAILGESIVSEIKEGKETKVFVSLRPSDIACSVVMV
jgi:hypothetical protein